MTTKEHELTLDRFWELVNQRKLDEAMQLYSESATIDLVGRKATGRAAIQAELQTFIDAFPDIEYRVVRRSGAGDVVVEEWTASGTHSGSFMGTQPTGANIVMNAVTIYEFKDGEVADDRTYADMTRILLTTGVLSRPAKTAT